MAVPGASTELDVANLALSYLGEPPIGSLADNVARARVMNSLLGIARDKTLRENDWNFSTAWIVPAALGTLSIGPLQNRFPMPSDCLRVRFVSDNAAFSPGDDIEELPNESWAIEAATVNPGDIAAAAMVMVTNVTSPLVCYTRQITLPALWDAEFIVAFARQLAGMGASQILKDPAMGKSIAGDAKADMDATALDSAREDAPKHISRSTTWVEARRIGTVYRPPFRDTGW